MYIIIIIIMVCEATPRLGNDKISFSGYGCLEEADNNDTIPFDFPHDVLKSLKVQC